MAGQKICTMSEIASRHRTGQNQPVSPGQLGSALGPDIIKMLAQRSGASEEEITRQLSQILPGVVDKLTPQGRLPSVAELSQTT
jgi:uncharacterized protein YidB (DUF937 family)